MEEGKGGKMGTAVIENKKLKKKEYILKPQG